MVNVIIDSKYVIKKRGLQGENGKSKVMGGDGLVRAQDPSEGSLSLQ